MEPNHCKLLSLFLGVLLFAGSSCEQDNNAVVYTKLAGIYSCEESSPYSGYKKYIVEIDKVSSQDNVYIISNFHNQGYAEFLYANLRNDSLYIENQVISGLFINGKGKVNEKLNEIEFHYTTDDGSLELDYYALFSR